MGEKDKIIIDTDIGTDIDDALALAYALGNHLDIALVTTVHYNTILRAAIARKLLTDFGSSIPVAAGASKPLKQVHLFGSGLEGRGYLQEEDLENIDTQGIDRIIETVKKYRGKVTIAAIGPLTNIALALQQAPEIEPFINQIYVMGNAIVRPEGYFCNYRAHNFKVDPEAVDLVFSSSIPTTIITTEVSKQHSIAKKDLTALALSKHPGLQYIGNAAYEWLSYIGYEQAYLYDPLVIHHCIDPAITEKRMYGKDAVTITVKPALNQLVLKTLLDFERQAP